MVNDEEALLNRIFSALSDPTRREILRRVTQADLTVGEIARPYSMSLPAVSKHLSVLEKAGLIHRVRRGRIHRVSANTEVLKEAIRHLEYYRQYFSGNFTSLKEIIPQKVR